MNVLLTPAEVDKLLRYPAGRALKLAKLGKLQHVRLPDDEIRFDRDVIDFLIASGNFTLDTRTFAHFAAVGLGGEV